MNSHTQHIDGNNDIIIEQLTKESIQANEEREDTLTEDHINLWDISLKEHIQREALKREVPQAAIWDKSHRESKGQPPSQQTAEIDRMTLHHM